MCLQLKIAGPPSWMKHEHPLAKENNCIVALMLFHKLVYIWHLLALYLLLFYFATRGIHPKPPLCVHPIYEKGKVIFS